MIPSKVLTKAADGKLLYAIAYNERLAGEWQPGIMHVHAADLLEAKFHFWGAVLKPGNIDLIGIAPAIGYKVLDNHGDKLIA